MDIKHPTLFKDVLHNASMRETHHENFAEGLTRGQVYGRGVVVSSVATLMAVAGISFLEALKIVKSHTKDTDIECIPYEWRADWNG